MILLVYEYFSYYLFNKSCHKLLTKIIIIIHFLLKIICFTFHNRNVLSYQKYLIFIIKFPLYYYCIILFNDRRKKNREVDQPYTDN